MKPKNMELQQFLSQCDQNELKQLLEVIEKIGVPDQDLTLDQLTKLMMLDQKMIFLLQKRKDPRERQILMMLYLHTNCDILELQEMITKVSLIPKRYRDQIIYLLPNFYETDIVTRTSFLDLCIQLKSTKELFQLRLLLESYDLKKGIDEDMKIQIEEYLCETDEGKKEKLKFFIRNSVSLEDRNQLMRFVEGAKEENQLELVSLLLKLPLERMNPDTIHDIVHHYHPAIKRIYEDRASFYQKYPMLYEEMYRLGNAFSKKINRKEMWVIHNLNYGLSQNVGEDREENRRIASLLSKESQSLMTLSNPSYTHILFESKDLVHWNHFGTYLEELLQLESDIDLVLLYHGIFSELLDNGSFFQLSKKEQTLLLEKIRKTMNLIIRVKNPQYLKRIQIALETGNYFEEEEVKRTIAILTSNPKSEQVTMIDETLDKRRKLMQEGKSPYYSTDTIHLMTLFLQNKKS